MQDFKQIQGQLNQAKKNKAGAGKEVFLFQEKLKKLDAQKERLSRANSEKSEAIQSIVAEQAKVKKQIEGARQSFNNLSVAELNLLKLFNPFTDPREHIDKFSDTHPVLLSPVRLETRFKKVTTDNEVLHQLWVRVFPDECSIDTFEDVPSESEIKNAKDYWTSVWSAGTSDDESLHTLIQNRKKAAWKVLGGSVQPGRAYWLIQNYQPSNLEDLPIRNSQTSPILTIPTEEKVQEAEALQEYWTTYWLANGDETLISQAFEKFTSGYAGSEEDAKKLLAQYTPTNINQAALPTVKVWYLRKEAAETVRPSGENEVILKIILDEKLTPAHKEALTPYWISVWHANGDASKEKEAFNALVEKVGSEDQATDLVKEYEPFNWEESPFPQVTVSFLYFPKSEDTDTKQSAWSQAASITSFPERFVLMGYKGKDEAGQPIEVLNEIGATIPDPLIVGPNPSVDTDDMLKEVFVGDFMALGSQPEQEEQLSQFYHNSVDAVKKDISEKEFLEKFLSLDEEGRIVELGNIFDQLRDDVKAAQYITYLCERSETKWLFDFDRAVEVGMGFKVNLSQSVYEAGFDRLFVLGTKLGADEEEGKNILEDLFAHHHYGNSGFSIVPQGTPTNNTEEEDSGFSEEEEADDTFERYFSEEEIHDPSDPLEKKDGRWLAELLGIDPDSSSLRTAENYYHTDQCEARAMNQALFNTTLGYFMESMITPVVDDQQTELVKSFFTEFVSGRGGIPAIRIGDQPYGILPISQVVGQNWLFRRENNPVLRSKYGNSWQMLQDLLTLLLKVREDFDVLSESVAYVGKEGDAHENLLQVLGLHSGSVEFDQRIAQSFSHMFNKAKLSGVLEAFIALLVEAGYKKEGIELLAKLGYTPEEGEEELVPILEKFFLTKQNRIHKDLIDDQPLSESKPIRGYTAPENEGDPSENYIQWLIDNAKGNFDNIKKQEGFADDKRPNTLLYQMLRQAVVLGYSDTGFNLYRTSELLSSSQIKAAKIDHDFIGVKEQSANTFESKWNYLDIKVNQITDSDITVAEHISNVLVANTSTYQTRNLRAVLDALEHLKDIPTARLERVLAEHLDCCSYRLDAWLMGFVRMQLELMREEDVSKTGPIYRSGLYLGAYGWVENLTPDDETLTPVNLQEPLKSIFDPEDTNEIVRDNNNGGYIHAPSINQAMTAAILRNAYISEAAAENPETYKVNLSSERVRMALGIIEGMQHGQSLSALLGYQLERGLHDRTDLELDVYIYELRKVFPLVSNQNRQTEVADDESFEEDKAITKIEARNVIDGLKLINHINDTGNKTYPFGFDTGEELTKLKQATGPQRTAINNEVDRILNINDAVADLAMAEGVHQVVQSNYDRASGALDTYSKGNFPQTPDVVRTPRSGVTLTHRVGLHLQSGITPPVNSNPRVLAEPAINDFVDHVLPDLADIVCQVILTTPVYNEEGASPTIVIEEVSMSDLGLTPIDLMYLIDVDRGKSLTALDDLILKYINGQIVNLRPDTEFEIKYTESIADKMGILEISPMIKSLKALLLEGRPLRNSDIQLPNEADETSDGSSIIDKSRAEGVFDKFLDVFVDKNDLDQGITLAAHAITANFDDEFKLLESATLQNLLDDDLDGYIDSFIDDLFDLNQFGIQEAGYGFVYDRKAEIYGGVYQKVLDYKKTWEDKLVDYDAFIAASAAVGLSDDEKIEILRKAERTISTAYTIPLPEVPDPDPIVNYEDILAKKRALFNTKLEQITDEFLDKSFVSFKDLTDALFLIKEGQIKDPDTNLDVDGSLSLFDVQLLDTTSDEQQIIVLAEDLIEQVTKLNTFLIKKAKAVQKLLTDHDATASPSNRVDLLTQAIQQLFGEDFKVIPEFELNEDHKNEIQQSYNDRDQLLTYQTDQEHVDFPVDDWMYGVSRVREKINHWENVVLLSEGLSQTELDMSPLQFPYQENDTWLALDYPESYQIDADKVLYTSYFRAFDLNQRQCGLLVDEWTEVIPTKEETTGLTFQYDQPNAEPSQAMLLATPTTFTGQWNWEELVGALHEALDLARLRAVEPEHLEKEAYAQFLPATVSTVTRHPLVTFAMNYALDTNFNFELNTN